MLICQILINDIIGKKERNRKTGRHDIIVSPAVLVSDVKDKTLDNFIKVYHGSPCVLVSDVKGKYPNKLNVFVNINIQSSLIQVDEAELLSFIGNNSEVYFAHSFVQHSDYSLDIPALNIITSLKMCGIHLHETRRVAIVYYVSDDITMYDMIVASEIIHNSFNTEPEVLWACNIVNNSSNTGICLYCIL